MNFSHIYIEDQCRTLPLAQKILSKFQESRVVPIGHYKEVFNRAHQSFSMQKQQVKLILARKHAPRLYEATERIRSRDTTHDVHYVDMVRNCIFDCQYCFLQGMHKTANILVFLNTEDYFQAVEKMLQKHSVFLSISYLSDLLALEHIADWNAQWIEFARDKKNLVLESRTKSDNFSSIQHLRVHHGTIFVWSLSPQELIQRYEYGCASLANRLFQIIQALRAGWRIRLAFDPVLLVDGWQHYYQKCFRYIFSRIPVKDIDAIYVGVFRMQKKQLRYMQWDRPRVTLLHDNIEEGKSLACARGIEEAKPQLIEMLCEYMNAEDILFVHG